MPDVEPEGPERTDGERDAEADAAPPATPIPTRWLIAVCVVLWLVAIVLAGEPDPIAAWESEAASRV